MLSTEGHEITILSFEKPHRYKDARPRLDAVLEKSKITWYPLGFSSRIRYFSKAWDLARMYVFALWIAVRKKIALVHCRSYQAAQVGLLLQALLGCKLLFDARGFWVDERIDGRIWSRQNLLEGLLYKRYKRLEQTLYGRADHIVALTHAALPFIESWAKPTCPPIEVIPCCADFQHFLPCSEKRADYRKHLDLDENSLVIGYVGSLGTWYLVEEMFRFYQHIARRYSNARFLIVTRDWGDEWENLWEKCTLSSLRSTLVVTSGQRHQMPGLLNACDVTLSFIEPSFSKVASSPTKIAESLAVGIPVIANPVGDVGRLVTTLDGGALISDFSDTTYAQVSERIYEIVKKGGAPLRARAETTLSLEVAALAYQRVYKRLERV